MVRAGLTDEELQIIEAKLNELASGIDHVALMHESPSTACPSWRSPSIS